MNTNDRDTLVEARRLAHWRALERMRQREGARARGQRERQEEYADLIEEWREAQRARRTANAWPMPAVGRGLLVLALLAACGAVGAVVGASVMLWTVLVK